MRSSLLVLGVWSIGLFSLPFAAAASEAVALADPSKPIESAWTRRGFGADTDYRRVTLDGRQAIRAVGRRSASGLYRDVGYRVAEHPWLEWTWRVDKVQTSADIRVKDGDDSAAAIFLLFGRPSLFRRNVPTLAYVWTGPRTAKGDVIASPYHPGTLKSFVLESGTERLGGWVGERRNVVEDYRRAFGTDPPETVVTIALWTDNDQTGEPVEANYGRIVALPDGSGTGR